ncbi:pyridoxal phosphate-dependent aminotransferase [Corynebacterium poyangense]|uniref:Pyridoxal phosphate-dependent aminotransferase n=1 Tax=Corynebacterium poyangense TaxID=2684405 RepID=A0A7H0SMQ9_9CORY|nr:pyridoxal phosphate-dependent aminotransferase [Corynebacterium poyangense]MBZ8176341.1 pyridoxal phosphate-dependent aminotransferase [Corynebacterium poyangense]QNQ89834.1 pyridoxal phosphate-dependent aminotransferase [Corynebacterium poyangense]
MNRVVQRLRPFQETVFATMTQKAIDHDAINLGQGFPDTNGPEAMLSQASEAILHGDNQYGNGRGLLALRQAISQQRSRDYEINYQPETDILVTVGATEAIAATILGLVEPGGEVIVFEPYYDAYAAAIALADAKRVSVPLKAENNSWDLDVAAFEDAISDHTSLVILNSPHNPTGSVFSADTLKKFAEICIRHDLLVLSDEVYENLLFDSLKHIPIASMPGMFERTITVSSAAKSYNVTGWKTGWALAPQPLLDGVIKAKQFLSYVGATPLQPAVAYALNNENEWLTNMVSELAQKREYLSSVLNEAGFHVAHTEGTYFIVVDISPLGCDDGVEFCFRLIEECGVAAIPIQVFSDHPENWKTKVRFAFCKQDHVLHEAGNRILQWAKKNRVEGR